MCPNLCFRTIALSGVNKDTNTYFPEPRPGDHILLPPQRHAGMGTSKEEGCSNIISWCSRAGERNPEHSTTNWNVNISSSCFKNDERIRQSKRHSCTLRESQYPIKRSIFQKHLSETTQGSHLALCLFFVLVLIKACYSSWRWRCLRSWRRYHLRCH